LALRQAISQATSRKLTQLKPARKPPVERAAARLGAVQALYQMDIAGTDVGETLAQFSSRAMGEDFDGGQCGEADYKHLREVVNGVVREQHAIDPIVDRLLDSSWPLHRLDTTVRAILRAAAFELMFMDKVPARVAISEYVDVASAFFDVEEPKFINGVLDRLARQRRPQEFAA
jgi:N utilization substance protein B